MTIEHENKVKKQIEKVQEVYNEYSTDVKNEKPNSISLVNMNYDLLFDNLMQGILILDPDIRFLITTYDNKEYCKVEVGKKASQFTNSVDRSSVQRIGVFNKNEIMAMFEPQIRTSKAIVEKGNISDIKDDEMVFMIEHGYEKKYERPADKSFKDIDNGGDFESFNNEDDVKENDKEYQDTLEKLKKVL